jgi:hypothetical protein
VQQTSAILPIGTETTNPIRLLAINLLRKGGALLRPLIFIIDSSAGSKDQSRIAGRATGTSMADERSKTLMPKPAPKFSKRFGKTRRGLVLDRIHAKTAKRGKGTRYYLYVSGKKSPVSRETAAMAAFWNGMVDGMASSITLLAEPECKLFIDRRKRTSDRAALGSDMRHSIAAFQAAEALSK